MASNRVLRAWSAGRQVLAAWMSTESIFAAQTLSASGVDAVVIDLQHGAAAAGDLPGLIAAIELRGAEPFVRVPTIDAGLIGRALDAGATGIIAPFVETPDQARALVEAALYPPAGRRSYGPRMAALRHGDDYARTANEAIVLLAMIETQPGLDALQEIVRTRGLTGLFVGPSDLAMSLGYRPPPRTMPRDVAAALAAIGSAASEARAKTGIFCSTGEAGGAALRAGFDLVTIPPDLAMIGDHARAVVEELRTILAGNVPPAFADMRP